MNMPLKSFLSFFCILFSIIGFSQKGVTTFGLHYKPIIPNRFIGMLKQDFNFEIFESSVQQKLGHTFGGIVRQGITKNISAETGLSINYRNYALDFAIQDSGYTAQNSVGTVSYQLPISALVFIRLGKKLYMNTALGLGINYYPSNVKKTILIDADQAFQQEGARKKRFMGALIANIGFEYRTKSKGYFYLGSSYNLPFLPEYVFAMSYEYPGGKKLAIDNIIGSYLTLDFRYYFHEKPNVEQKRK